MKRWVLKTASGLIVIMGGQSGAEVFERAMSLYGLVSSMRPAHVAHKAG